MSTFRVRFKQGPNALTQQGYLDTFAGAIGTITNATNSAPIVCTSVGHGLITGQRVTVSGVFGNTAANADWIITVLNANAFSLNNSIGNGAYISGGTFKTDSVQETMYCMGPNLRNRKLVDGATFTDCNYWKQFSYPTMPYNQSFIEVVSDDGSIYIPGQSATFPVVYTLTSTTSVAANTVNFPVTYGGPSIYTLIQNTGGSAVNVTLNNSASAIFNLAAGGSLTFSSPEQITQLGFSVPTAGSPTNCQVLATVQVVCAS